MKSFEPAGVRGLLSMRTSARHRPMSADAEVLGNGCDSSADDRPSTAPPAGARALTPSSPADNPASTHEPHSWLSSNLGAVAEDDCSALAEASDALEGIKNFNTEWQQEREKLLQQLEKEYGFARPRQVNSESACEPAEDEIGNLADAEDEHEADCALESAQKELEEVRKRRQEVEERASRPASRAGPQPSQSSSAGSGSTVELQEDSEARLSSLRAEVARLKAAEVAPPPTAPPRASLALQPPEEVPGAMADLNDWLSEVRAITEGASPKKIGQVASPARTSPARSEHSAKSRLEELATLRAGGAVDSSVLAVSKSDLERQLDEILGEFDEFDRIANDLGTALSPECVA